MLLLPDGPDAEVAVSLAELRKAKALAGALRDMFFELLDGDDPDDASCIVLAGVMEVADGICATMDIDPDPIPPVGMVLVKARKLGVLLSRAQAYPLNRPDGGYPADTEEYFCTLFYILLAALLESAGHLDVKVPEVWAY